MDRVRAVPGLEGLPEPYPYHSASEFATAPGYWPNLDAEQLDALVEMCQRWSKLEIASSAGEHVVLLLLRFLRARSFNVNRAWQMLEQDMQWRTQKNVEQLRTRTADDVLECNAADVYTYFPTWLQGFDRQGRPVAYRQYGNFEIWELLKMSSMERLLDFHVWEIEQQISLLNKQTEAAKTTVETFLIVMDANNWSLRLATRDAYTYIRGMAEIDNTHFPERLGKLYVINAPSVLSFAWRMISSWIDPATRDKISILSAPADWQAALFEDVDRDQVPQMYGGLAPDPTPEVLRNFDPDAMIAAYQRSKASTDTDTAAQDVTIDNIPPTIATPAEAVLPIEKSGRMQRITEHSDEDDDAGLHKRAGFAQEHELLANVVSYVSNVWGSPKPDQDETQSIASVATNLDGYYTPRASEDADWKADLALARTRQNRTRPEMVDQAVQTDPIKVQGCCTIS